MNSNGRFRFRKAPVCFIGNLNKGKCTLKRPGCAGAWLARIGFIAAGKAAGDGRQNAIGRLGMQFILVGQGPLEHHKSRGSITFSLAHLGILLSEMFKL
jgi:hypothetical protein